MNIYKRPTKGGVVLLLLSFLSDPGRSDAETGQMEAAERESLEARFCRQEFAIMSWTVPCQGGRLGFGVERCGSR